MRNVYKNTMETWTVSTKGKKSKKRLLQNKYCSKRYRIHCHYIEETRLGNKPNIQNAILEIVNYRQNGYFLEKNFKKVLQNAQMCYILKLRKRLSYKTGRTE